MKRLSRRAFFFLALFCVSPPQGWSDIEGVPTGWWSDYEGNNYYGNPPSKGADDSYSPAPYYDSALYQATSNAASQFGQAINNWFQQAAEAQRQALERRTQGLQLNTLGNQALNARNWDEAISYYEQALAYTPGDPAIQDNLRRARALKVNEQGVQRHREKDWGNAISYYKQALEIAPEDRTIRKNLTLAERMKGVEKEQALQEKLVQASREAQPRVEQIVSGLKPPSASPVLIAQKRELPIEPFEWKNTEDPSLKGDAKPPLGTARGAGEHAQSAQRHAEKIREMLKRPQGVPFDPMAESLSSEAGKAFDTPGEYAGALRKPEIKAEGMGVEELQIPEERMNDPSLKPLAEKWNQMDRNHRGVEDAYEKLKAKEDKTPQDFVEMATTKAKLHQIEYEQKILKRDWEEKLAQPKVEPRVEKPPPAPEVKESKGKEKSKGQRIEMIE